VYKRQILPHKLALSLTYVETRSLGRDLHILWKTFLGILGSGRK
jgi:lipopolysaccharide/colanic/teichoic acid biosynthesis glycosyltransferase